VILLAFASLVALIILCVPGVATPKTPTLGLLYFLGTFSTHAQPDAGMENASTAPVVSVASDAGQVAAGKDMPVKPQDSGTPIFVTIEASVTGGHRPKVTGTTNLPDGARMKVFLTRPSAPASSKRVPKINPACNPDCLFYEDIVVVSSGQFFSDFSHGTLHHGTTDGIKPGQYRLWIYTVANQPLSVSLALGERGALMRGPLVGYEPSAGWVAAYTLFGDVGIDPTGRH
jgi:hypothetical protein